jgi:hypothetical protein
LPVIGNTPKYTGQDKAVTPWAWFANSWEAHCLFSDNACNLAACKQACPSQLFRSLATLSKGRGQIWIANDSGDDARVDRELLPIAMSPVRLTLNLTRNEPSTNERSHRGTASRSPRKEIRCCSAGRFSWSGRSTCNLRRTWDQIPPEWFNARSCNNPLVKRSRNTGPS